MKEEPRVEQVSRVAFQRIHRLRLLAREVVVPLDSQSRRALAYVVIESSTIWLEYSKAYYFFSAMKALDRQGTRISHQQAFVDEDDALGYAINVARPLVKRKPRYSHRDHPDWRAPGVINKLLEAMKASSLSAWQLGMGMQSHAPSDVFTMRNFFAHKNEESAVKARRLRTHYGVTQNLSPCELLANVPPQSQQPLVREWLDDLTAMVTLAIV